MQVVEEGVAGADMKKKMNKKIDIGKVMIRYIAFDTDEIDFEKTEIPEKEITVTEYELLNYLLLCDLISKLLLSANHFYAMKEHLKKGLEMIEAQVNKEMGIDFSGKPKPDYDKWAIDFTRETYLMIRLALIRLRNSPVFCARLKQGIDYTI